MSRFAKFLVSFLIFIAAGYLGLRWFVNSEVARELDATVAATPGLSLNYGELNVDILSRSIRLDRVHAILPDGNRLSADTVRIYAFDQQHQVPLFLKAEAAGLTFTPEPETALLCDSLCRFLDVGALRADCALDYSFDKDNGTLTINNLTVDVDNVAQLRLSCTFRGLDSDLDRVERLLGLTVQKAELRFTNRSVVNRFLTLAGETRELSPDQARDMMVADLSRLSENAAADDNDVAEQAFQALGAFLRNPEALTLKAAPGEPVPLLWGFMGRDLADNLRLFNVTVTPEESDI